MPLAGLRWVGIAKCTTKHRVLKHTYTLNTRSYKKQLTMCFETYIHAQNATKHSVFKHTYTLKRLRKHEILRNLSVYVCFKTLCFVVFLKQIHTRWRLNFIEKYESVCMFEAYIHTRLAAWDIHTHTLGRLRHTYMLRGLRHTYILTVRPSH